MMDFNVEEMNFLCIVRGTDRADTINNIYETIPNLDNNDMKQIAETLIGKLDSMTDDDFNDISFDGTFEE